MRAKNGISLAVGMTPAKPRDLIILWGAGFGPTTPAAPVGVETPATTTYNVANITVTVGGVAATVYGAALTPGYAGLYQVAIQIACRSQIESS